MLTLKCVIFSLEPYKVFLAYVSEAEDQVIRQLFWGLIIRWNLLTSYFKIFWEGKVSKDFNVRLTSYQWNPLRPSVQLTGPVKSLLEEYHVGYRAKISCS